jgi:membrane associated rhomboid family serine protease
MADLNPDRIIPARNRREVMEWSLALVSQEIEATILRTETGWGLGVEARDYDKAVAVIQQYIHENRGWRWKLRLPASGLMFHYGAIVWAAAMAGFYYWTMEAFPQLQSAGMMKNDLVADGQWWRLFTAITLHENLTHLVANLGTGFLLFGLAMSRYGPGVALLAAFLAGAAGNGLDLLVHSKDSQSLGASGMVMGALGMLSVHSFSIWRKYKAARRGVWRSVAAGFLILVLTGFGPGSDVAAHLGGFVAGALVGIGLNTVRPVRLQRRTANVLAALALAGLVTAAWRQALAGR